MGRLTAEAERLPFSPSARAGFRSLGNKANVDILFEAQLPPPPTPDVEIRVLKDVDRVEIRSVSTVGTPLGIGFVNNRPREAVTIQSLDINGVNFPVTLDSSGQFAGITQNAWTPSQPGTYLLRTNALSPIAGAVAVSSTVRIVAAGGSVDTDNAQPPRPLEGLTYPKTNRLRCFRSNQSGGVRAHTHHWKVGGYRW